jgi:hypothetical protein
LTPGARLPKLSTLLSGEGCLWWHICGLEYVKVGRQSDRDGIAKFLYDHYRPECNGVDPGGAPVEVNPP